MNEKVKIWCILIPTLKSEHASKPYFSTKHHREWDKFVRKTSGGLTIFAPGKGQWISPESELIVERIIPVNIACTDEEFKKIINFTIKHYNQDSLMYYKISDEVFFAKKGETI